MERGKWARLSSLIFENLPPRSVVTINGCGGKTSLMRLLSRTARRFRTLITTTTHIGMPSREEYDYIWEGGRPPCGRTSLRPTPRAGDTPATPPDLGSREWGVGNRENVCEVKITDSFEASGSSETIAHQQHPDSRPQPGITLIPAALPLSELENIIPLFDYTFIEGDGSRTLPLKGWADYEPVVPESTTHTIGVLPLWTLGMKISGQIIHRLPLFLSLTGAKEGDTLSEEHIARAIAGKKGLFKEAKGKKILFFNQIEDDKTLLSAKKISALIPQDFLRGLELIAAGSVRRDSAVVL